MRAARRCSRRHLNTTLALIPRVLLLRRQGAVIRRERDYADELDGSLTLAVGHYDEDHLYRLELYRRTEGSTKGKPLAVLLDPQLLRVASSCFGFRGIERVPAAGDLRFAGLVQEWRVQPR